MVKDVKLTEKRKISIDEALDLAGGFGPYQVYLSIFVILGMNSLGTFLWNMHFSQAVPTYECVDRAGKWVKCEATEFCPNEWGNQTYHSYRVVEDLSKNPYYIRNWYQ